MTYATGDIFIGTIARWNAAEIICGRSLRAESIVRASRFGELKVVTAHISQSAVALAGEALTLSSFALEVTAAGLRIARPMYSAERLFFSLLDGSVVISNRLSVLRPLVGAGRIEPSLLYDIYRYERTLAPLTMYEGIQSLPPDCALEIDADVHVNIVKSKAVPSSRSDKAALIMLLEPEEPTALENRNCHLEPTNHDYLVCLPKLITALEYPVFGLLEWAVLTNVFKGGERSKYTFRWPGPWTFFRSSALGLVRRSALRDARKAALKYGEPTRRRLFEMAEVEQGPMATLRHLVVPEVFTNLSVLGRSLKMAFNLRDCGGCSTAIRWPLFRYDDPIGSNFYKLTLDELRYARTRRVASSCFTITRSGGHVRSSLPEISPLIYSNYMTALTMEYCHNQHMNA